MWDTIRSPKLMPQCMRQAERTMRCFVDEQFAKVTRRYIPVLPQLDGPETHP